MFAGTKEKGTVAAFPDVCKTASPVGTIPIPYPNAGQAPTANPAANKVMINGMPALTKASKITPTNGDEAGNSGGGGATNSKTLGPAEFTLGSQCVKIEGNPAVKMGDMTTQNDKNAIGAMAAPSQTKLMIMK